MKCSLRGVLLQPVNDLIKNSPQVLSDASAKRRADIDRAALSAAVDQCGDAIVITDTLGRIQYVNPAFTGMTGYTLEEAVGQTPRVLKSGCETQDFYKELWETIR